MNNKGTKLQSKLSNKSSISYKIEEINNAID